MEKLHLNAQKRTVIGRKVKKLRKEGMLPANLYGKKRESVSLEINYKDFETIFTKAGETGLIELALEGKKYPCLIHHVQSDPITQLPIHIDFFQVDLKEKVTTKVPLAIIGESPAVKDKIGVLLHILSEIEIEALPADLPDKIEVDVSGLLAVGNSIKVGDLKTGEKIKVLNDVQVELIKVAPLVSKEAEKLQAEEAQAKAAAAAESSAGAPVEGKAPVTAASETKSSPSGEGSSVVSKTS